MFDEKTHKWLWDGYSEYTTELNLQPLDKVYTKKPQAPIIGADGNVFNLIGICSRTLRRAGSPDKAKEMTNRITNSASYEEALSIMCEYIEPVDQNYQTIIDSNNYDIEI